MGSFDASKYTIVVKKVRADNEDLFYATVNEIPDISSYSETYQDAYEDCLDALEILYDEAQSQGKTFPKPFALPATSRPSGRVTLRMSRSMHERVARYAKEDDVSLNQWIVEAISQRCGTYSAKSSLASSSTAKAFAAVFSYKQQIRTTATKWSADALGSTSMPLSTSFQNEALQES